MGREENCVCISYPFDSIFGYSRLENIYNAQGQLVERRYINKEEQPTPNDLGCARMVFTTIGKGGESQCFDINDKPVVETSPKRQSIP